MAETDMKPISDLDAYINKFDSNSLLPVVVRPDNSNVARKVYFDGFKIHIVGYELVGTLTAGSTSITLPATAPTAYNSQNTYAVGDRVVHETKNYMCIRAITGSTDRNWENDSSSFVEYDIITGNSTISVYVKEGSGPYIQTIVPVSYADNAVTLTFESQISDISVKVRVS
ncbi:MAG: hypothetical protein J6Y02_20880 [Pseudobutyrivibrio sp.]|nr:hypothetical protein [Pseudobutyrivibrio sp.]